MVDRKTSVDDVYASRHRPYGQNRDAGARRSLPHEPDMAARDEQRPQMPEDQHGPKYDNRTSGWVHGANEDATRKPGFDRGNAWRMKDSNNWHSGSDPAVIRKPVGEK